MQGGYYPPAPQAPMGAQYGGGAPQGGPMYTPALPTGYQPVQLEQQAYAALSYLSQTPGARPDCLAGGLEWQRPGPQCGLHAATGQRRARAAHAAPAARRGRVR